MRGALRWREGDFDGRHRAAARAPPSSASRSAAPRSPSRRSSGSPPRCASAATTPSADTELSRALDICERAGLVAQSVEAISARAVTLVLAGRHDAAREAAEEAEQPRRAAALSGRQGGERSRPRAPSTRTTPPAPRRWPRRATAWLELGRPLDAARCGVHPRAGPACTASPTAAARRSSSPPRRPSATASPPRRARPRRRVRE